MTTTFLWTSVGVAEWNLIRPLNDEETDAVIKLLHSFELDSRVHRTDANYLSWHFHVAGIDEPTRRRLQPEIASRLAHLKRDGSDITVHWDGVRVRVDAARAMNEHVQ